MAIKNKICGIYMIQCNINGMVYIGQSKNIGSRITSHKTSLKKNRHTNKNLQKDYNEYGIKCFEYFLLEECSCDLFDERERFWITQYENLYNMTSGGIYGNKYSEEARRKLSISHMGKSNGPLTENHKQKIGDSQRGEKNHMYGKKHTKESREKMSKVQIGNTNWLGKKFSEEHKRKISESNKGKKMNFTKEHKNKISIALKGRINGPHSEETKRKIAETKIGAKNPMYGKRPSEKNIEANRKRLSGKNNPMYREITEEMKNDFKSGMTRKDWLAKHKLSGTIWDKIRKGVIN